MSSTKSLLPDSNTQGDANMSEEFISRYNKYKWWSIRVCYGVMFFTSVSYSIQMPSLWPYMNTVNHSFTKHFFGWVVASYSIGQLVACPVFTLICGRTHQFKTVLLLAAIVSALANYLYAVIIDIHGSMSQGASLIASRVAIGISGGNVAVVRLFLLLVTTDEERIGPMSTLSACQALGFIVGPGLQAAFVPLKYPGFINIPFFRINTYTATAYFSIITNIFIIIILAVFFSSEIVSQVSVMNSLSSVSYPPDYYKSDYISGVFMLITFFFCMMTLAIFETIVTPLTMDNFDWSKMEATLYNSISLACTGLCSIGIFLLVKVITKKIRENIMLVIAFAFILAANLVLIPFGNEKMPFKNESIQSNTSGGCDLSLQPWCAYVPAIQLWQYIICLSFFTLGYPAANVLSYVIFSRLINSDAQSLWMGLLTSGGSLARVVGPIFIAKTYESFGTEISFATSAGIILLFMAFLPYFTIRMIKLFNYRLQLSTATIS